MTPDSAEYFEHLVHSARYGEIILNKGSQSLRMDADGWLLVSDFERLGLFSTRLEPEGDQLARSLKLTEFGRAFHDACQAEDAEGRA